MAAPDPSFVTQHLRSIIIHSIDTLNYGNAEFAGERLMANDPDNLDSLYLYCLVLFHQKKYKTCYNKLSDAGNHLGCSYLFGKACVKLKKYKEGIFQLLKVSYLYNDSVLSFDNLSSPLQNGAGATNKDNFFVDAKSRYAYESHRSVVPDASAIYHLLGDLYKGVGDIKNSSMNYGYSLKYNPFDFEAFQELCKLGVDVKVKTIFKGTKGDRTVFDTIDNNASSSNLEPHISNPFTSPNEHQKNNVVIHADDSFNNLSTPRVRTTIVPNAPLRKSTNTHDSLNKFEFTKPTFPQETYKKKESTYSRITSRLISQPNSTTTVPSNGAGGSERERPVLKNGMKRTNSAASIIPITDKLNPHTAREIESSNDYLLHLFILFAKGYKCYSKYDCYKAIRILESLPVREKMTPWVLSKLGRLHYEIVNYKQSEHFFTQLRKLDRSRLEDMEYFSTLLWHLQKKVELTFLANELHDLDNKSPITWCVIGNLFSLTREQDEAIKCFNKSIKLDESFTYAYTLKGHEYFSNDNYEMALENFRISLLIDPRHYNALYGIGMVYINLGDYAKADYHFRKAVSINPINVILICCVGMVLEKLGKKNLALRQYELANKLQPLNPLPIFKKAQLLFTMQQFKQSLQLFEHLKDLAPDEASVHFLLGQLYNIQDDKFEAIREFTIALNLDPKGNYLIREAMESLHEK